MHLAGRNLSRCIGIVLVCALLAPSAAWGAPKPLTPEKVHARILKRGLGNWIGVQLQNGTAFAGIIVRIDENSLGMQLHNDPQVWPVRYSDVVRLSTGIPGGAIVAIAAAGIAAVIVTAVVAHHEMARMPSLPTQPTQPVFP